MTNAPIALALAAIAAGVMGVAEVAAAENCRAPFAGARIELRCQIARMQDGPVPVEAVIRADGILAAQGYRERFGLVPDPPDPALEAGIRPLLQFHPNLNAGNPPGDIVLGGVIFEGDPDLERKQGLLVGATFTTAARASTGEGRSLLLRLEASHGRSPEHGLGVATLGLGACSLNHLGEWWYLDLCASGRRVEREILQENEADLELALARVFSGPHGQYEAGLSVRRLWTDEYGQSQMGLRLDALHDRRWFTGLALRAGESLENTLAFRWGANATVGARFSDWDLGLSASYERWEGGYFLGFDREDDRRALSLTVSLRDRIGVTAGYAWRSSSIGYFDIEEPFVALRVGSIPIR